MGLLPALHHVARWFTLAVTIFMLVAVLSPSLGGFSAASFGAYHPFFMVLGFVLFMSMGVVSYVSDYGNAINRRFPDRGSRRLLHGTLQLLAGTCVVIGYLVHFTYSQWNGESHIAAGDPTWRQVHVWFGIISVAGVMVQVVVGMYKYVVRQREGYSVMKWHGYLGLVVWLAGLTTVSVAVYGWFWLTNGKRAVAVAIWVCLAVLIILTLVTVFQDPSRRAAATAGPHDHRMDDFGDSINTFNEQRGDSLNDINGKPLLEAR